MNTSESPSPQRRFNTRLGLFLFLVYLALYSGFVLINAFAADKMEIIVLAGLNLAIVYGFGLIAFALVLALIYGMLCQKDPAEDIATEEAAAAPGDSK
ncbi:MAG: DUF485 domain-containing protein [Rubripirellula sp.]|jgi:uncharacterized membrane protein (DUF485 family)